MGRVKHEKDGERTRTRESGDAWQAVSAALVIQRYLRRDVRRAVQFFTYDRFD
jgi:hypothetical protein